VGGDEDIPDNNNDKEQLVMCQKIQMQIQQRTHLSNRETKKETSVSSAYSLNSSKRLSNHVNLSKSSSMQPELRIRSCDSRIFSCVHAG